MTLLATALQQAGIGFISATAKHMGGLGGALHVSEIILESEDDLTRFVIWAVEKGVNFDNCRVATPEEIKASREWS